MRRNYPFARFLKLTAVLLAALTVLFAVLFLRMRPLLYKTAVSNAESLMLRLTDQAVAQVLEGDGISYEKIVKLTVGENGAVTSLQVDPLTVNLLKTQISDRVSELVGEQQECGVSLPLGTLLGSEYTTGFGPQIHFPMQITATAYINFKSNFYDSGINQVLHQILIEIEVRGIILTVGSKYSFSTSTSAIAAQSVIVGSVPDAYTEVIEQPENDMASWIFDYGYLD